MTSTSNIQLALLQFNATRSKKKKQQLISGFVSLAGLIGFWFPPLVLLSLVGILFYWVLFWQISKMKCPNCKESFGVGKKTIRGNGITSCYHCGFCLDGTILNHPKSHDREWLE